MINPIAKLYRKVRERLTMPRRSPLWPKTRREHLKKEWWCRSCQSISGLEVHHIIPYHVNAALELDRTNFITLCENMGRQCHLHWGHLGNWKNYNPMIKQQADMPAPLLKN